MSIPWAALFATAALLAAQGFAAPAAEAHGDHRYHSHPGQEEGKPDHKPGYGWPGYVPGSTSVYGPSTGVGVSVYGGQDGVNVGLYVPLYLGPAYQTRQALIHPPLAPSTAIPGQLHGLGAGCQDVRFYETEIVVDGETVPAHGEACLQPDGSWRVLSGPSTGDY